MPSDIPEPSPKKSIRERLEEIPESRTFLKCVREGRMIFLGMPEVERRILSNEKWISALQLDPEDLKKYYLHKAVDAFESAEDYPGFAYFLENAFLTADEVKIVSDCIKRRRESVNL